MRFQFAALGPAVSRIMMIDVAQQQARRGTMHDQAYVAVHPYRPEALVLRLVELVEAHARVCGVDLQVEGGHLHRLLLIAGQAREAVGEGVGDAKVHYLPSLNSGPFGTSFKGTASTFGASVKRFSPG